MSEPDPAARPAVAWMNVLDHTEQSLERSLAQTPEPEPTPDAADPPRNHLARLDERLAAWQSSLAQVERLATASAERLNAENAALTEWLAKLGRVRDSYTRWVDAHPAP